MLAYLDTLCQALSTRDASAIRRLLRHPLAIALPRAVRVEAFALARAGTTGRLAPTRTLHFYYQTQQLLASSAPTPAMSEYALFEFSHHDHSAVTAAASHM